MRKLLFDGEREIYPLKWLYLSSDSKRNVELFSVGNNCAVIFQSGQNFLPQVAIIIYFLN